MTSKRGVGLHCLTRPDFGTALGVFLSETATKKVLSGQGGRLDFKGPIFLDRRGRHLRASPIQEFRNRQVAPKTIVLREVLQSL